MLKWREGFDRKILERGRDSFKNQAVWGLTRGAGGWEAVVIGTEMYPVEIALDGGTVSRTECACPYAEKGHRCKHMAAVLYTLEARWPEVLEDRDEALAGKMEEWSSEEVELALKLAIDVRSMRCTALLLNRSDGNNHFSPDEFNWIRYSPILYITSPIPLAIDSEKTP